MIEPNDGRLPRRKPEYSSGAVWPSCWNFMLRTRANLSADLLEGVLDTGAAFLGRDAVGAARHVNRGGGELGLASLDRDAEGADVATRSAANVLRLDLHVALLDLNARPLLEPLDDPGD